MRSLKIVLDNDIPDPDLADELRKIGYQVRLAKPGIENNMLIQEAIDNNEIIISRDYDLREQGIKMKDIIPGVIHVRWRVRKSDMRALAHMIDNALRTYFPKHRVIIIYKHGIKPLDCQYWTRRKLRSSQVFPFPDINPKDRFSRNN